MITRRFWLVAILGMECAMWTAAGPAHADDPALTVYVIHGTNGGGGVEGSIKDIVRRMGNAAGMFDTYRLLKKERVTVAVGSTKRLSVPGNREIVLKPTSVSDKELHLEATVAKKGGRGTKVTGRIVKGGTFVFAGYKHNGGQLFFAVNARY